MIFFGEILQTKRKAHYLAFAEGMEHSNLLLTLSKISVKNSASRGANKALIVKFTHFLGVNLVV